MGVNCVKFSNVDRFLQSNSVNNIYKLLQLVVDEVPQIPYGGFAPGLHWGTLLAHLLIT